ncbi:unnamed protein product [Closterium sp. NIES-54]
MRQELSKELSTTVVPQHLYQPHRLPLNHQQPIFLDRSCNIALLGQGTCPCEPAPFVDHGEESYHPTSRRVFPSQDVTFDESVPLYRLFTYRSAPPPPLPLFLAPGPPLVDPLLPQGPAPSGVSQIDPLPGTVPVEVACDSGAARGAASGGTAFGGAELGGAEPGGAEPGGAESEGAGSGGAELGDAEPGGAELAGVEPGGAEPEGVEPGGAESEGAESRGAEPRGAASSGGAGATGDTRAGGAGVTAGAGGTGGTAAAGPGGACTRGTGAARTGGVRGAGAGDPTEPRDAGAEGERREPASRPAFPFRTGRRVPHPRPPPVPSTHAMALRPSSVPLRVPLPAPLESSLPSVPDPESDLARAARPTVSRLLATVVTDPSFESTATSALVAELVEFAAASRIDYATALVVESDSASPPSVGGECALGTDILEDRQEDFECLAATVPRFASMLLALEGDPDAQDILTLRSYAEVITGPYTSKWQAAMDAEMASWKSTGTYVDEVPPPGANIFDGMWIFRVKQPPGSPPAFKARYIARGFSHYLGLQITRDRARRTITLTQSHMVHKVLQRFGFQFSSPQPTPLSTGHSLSAPYPELVGCLMYLMTCTRPDLAYPLSLLARYVALGRHRKVHWDAAKRVLRYLCSTSGMGFVLGGRGPVVVIGHADASWVDDSATQRSSQGYTFSLGSGSVSWRSTRSSSVLSSSCEAEIYAGAMAAQELRWLTYLLIDLGEQPRSPPVLYVDNKAMIALC